MFEETVAINLFGAFRMATATRELLAASAIDGGASVVNLGSMSSFFGIEIVPGYGAAKAGVVQMTKTLAVAWAGHGIRVNAVAPGVVETNMTAPMLPFEQMTRPLLDRTPLGRFATPRRDRARGAVPRQSGRPLHHRPHARGRRRLLDRRLMVTGSDVETFWRDGVVCLRGALPADLLEAMAEPVDVAINGDQSADLSALAGAPENGARFVAGVDHWRTQPALRAFAFESALPAIVAALLRSSAVWLYEDSVLVKEPGAREATEWHQDLGLLPRRRHAVLHHLVPARPGRRCDGGDAVRSRLAPVRRDLPAQPVRHA